MTDLEITRLCAEAMGGQVTHDLPRGHKGEGWIRLNEKIFEPLHDDAQAMALVKKLRLYIDSKHGSALLESENMWTVEYNDGEQATISSNADLNRAVCECVAKMQKAKT